MRQEREGKKIGTRSSLLPGPIKDSLWSLRGLEEGSRRRGSREGRENKKREGEAHRKMRKGRREW